MKDKKEVKKREFFNKKIRHEYEILDSFEVGIALTGVEIKAVRSGRVDMTSSYAKIMNSEVLWLGGNINVESGERQRTRKLLLHKDQIKKLVGKTSEKGLSLLPLKLYFKKGRLKMELGVGRGLKKYEKREKLKRKDIEREIATSIKDTRYKKQ